MAFFCARVVLVWVFGNGTDGDCLVATLSRLGRKSYRLLQVEHCAAWVVHVEGASSATMGQNLAWQDYLLTLSWRCISQSPVRHR